MKNYFRILAWIILGTVVSCKTDEPKPGADGLTSLLKVSNEASGLNCVAGGTRIDTGIDKNKNGILDTEEIQSTVYVCNGNNGLNNLINFTIEPAGANCANGGFKIDTGLDLNKDGLLNPGEITKTVYQCNDIVTKYEIGMNYGGGIIFYLDATKTHGLIAAPSDQAYAEWSPTSTTTNATAIGLGTGQSNTNLITSTLGNGNYAAILCDQLVLNGFSDWFLPSRDELITLYNQKTVVGGFTDDHYWSSTETAGNTAFGLLFSNGGPTCCFAKSNQLPVRAIRAF